MAVIAAASASSPFIPGTIADVNERECSAGQFYRCVYQRLSIIVKRGRIGQRKLRCYCLRCDSPPTGALRSSGRRSFDFIHAITFLFVTSLSLSQQSLFKTRRMKNKIKLSLSEISLKRNVCINIKAQLVDSLHKINLI